MLRIYFILFPSLTETGVGTELQINMFPAEKYTTFPPALPRKHLQLSPRPARSLQASARRARVGHGGVT